LEAEEENNNSLSGKELKPETGQKVEEDQMPESEKIKCARVGV